MNNPNVFNPSQDLRGIIHPLAQTQRTRIGLATLGGFNPPTNVNTTNNWVLVREGGKKEANSFPPPINDINWQGFFTKEVNGYSRKLFWVCGYGILPSEYASGKPMMIMVQWWHTEQVTIADYRNVTAEDWDNANIYIASMERLEDIFIATQLATVNTSMPTEPNKTEWADVIEVHSAEVAKSIATEVVVETPPITEGIKP